MDEFFRASLEEEALQDRVDAALTATSTALEQVRAEVERAVRLHAPMHSPHEGYGVLLEEVDELKDEVWKSPKRRDYEAMHTEAVHVAAMAIRFMTDVTIPALKRLEREAAQSS